MWADKNKMDARMLWHFSSQRQERAGDVLDKKAAKAWQLQPLFRGKIINSAGNERALGGKSKTGAGKCTKPMTRGGCGGSFSDHAVNWSLSNDVSQVSVSFTGLRKFVWEKLKKEEQSCRHETKCCESHRPSSLLCHLTRFQGQKAWFALNFNNSLILQEKLRINDSNVLFWQRGVLVASCNFARLLPRTHGGANNASDNAECVWRKNYTFNKMTNLSEIPEIKLNRTWKVPSWRRTGTYCSRRPWSGFCSVCPAPFMWPCAVPYGSQLDHGKSQRVAEPS